MRKTERFFDAGYGLQKSPLQEFPEQEFIIDFPGFEKSLGFAEELENWSRSLLSQKRQIILVDDGSLYSDFFRLLFSKTEVEFKTVLISTDDEIAWEMISGILEFLQPKDYLEAVAADLAMKTGALIICPKFELRIWNFNYNRVHQKQYGAPYFVYIESEKSHLLRSWANRHELSIQWNVALESPTLFRSYFLIDLLQEWLRQEECSEAHNDRLDRRIFAGLAGGSDLYKLQPIPQKKLSQFQEKLKPRDFQKAMFPIHGFYQKYLNQTIHCNQTESFIYGLGN